MVSCHWQVSPTKSHTVTFSLRYGAVWASVVTFDDEEVRNPTQGALESMAQMLRRRPYDLTSQIMSRGYRMEKGPCSARVLNAVLHSLQEEVAA